MSESDKIKPSHHSRMALVYVRQSSAAQVEHNRESTLRQYALAQRAAALGWPPARITIIDDDLGLSGTSAHQRGGFARVAADVALGHVGLILGLEVSRLARNNADWYRLLDLCAMTDTLIGDADGLYHPSLFNDRANAVCTRLESLLANELTRRSRCRRMRTKALASSNLDQGAADRLGAPIGPSRHRAKSVGSAHSA
jgi:DNA invertase Pin-like site-specific DNA recombinase